MALKNPEGPGGITPPKIAATPSVKIQYLYSKSKDCRIVNADGAWGGLTQSNKIQIGFFNDGIILPKSLTVTVENDVVATKVDTSDAVSREMQVEVNVSVEVAKSLVEWLQTVIAEAESIEEKKRSGEIKGWNTGPIFKR